MSRVQYSWQSELRWKWNQATDRLEFPISTLHPTNFTSSYFFPKQHHSWFFIRGFVLCPWPPISLSLFSRLVHQISAPPQRLFAPFHGAQTSLSISGRSPPSGDVVVRTGADGQSRLRRRLRLRTVSVVGTPLLSAFKISKKNLIEIIYFTVHKKGPSPWWNHHRPLCDGRYFFDFIGWSPCLCLMGGKFVVVERRAKFSPISISTNYLSRHLTQFDIYQSSSPLKFQNKSKTTRAFCLQSGKDRGFKRGVARWMPYNVFSILLSFYLAVLIFFRDANSML